MSVMGPMAATRLMRRQAPAAVPGDADLPLPAIRPLWIGPVKVDPPILQAPMAGFTNYAFRQIVRELGGAVVSPRVPREDAGAGSEALACTRCKLSGASELCRSGGLDSYRSGGRLLL